MKVNSIGINAYQKLAEQPAQNRKPVSADEKATEKTGKINIPVQTNQIGSRLGVKLQGNEFMNMLSDEEKRAFELVFEKFNGNNGSKSAGREGLGRFVDVKL